MRQRLPRVEKIQQTCRHFNGIQHDRCYAGVDYRGLMEGSTTGSGRLPCLPAFSPDDPPPVSCALLNRPTREEAEAEVRESDARLEAWKTAIREGRCPTCGKQIERVQRGSCVYGSCGHRLYQGRV